MKKIINDWKKETIVSYIVIFTVFQLFFYEDKLSSIYMSLKFFFAITIPGVLFVQYIFQDRFGRYEKMALGTGFGLVITPLMLYLVSIFEFVHVQKLAFVMPFLIIFVLSFLLMNKNNI